MLCSSGDMVTLTNQPDVHKAVSELIEANERRQSGSHSPRLPQGQFPPLCLFLHPVDSAVRPPPPPLLSPFPFLPLISCNQTL